MMLQAYDFYELNKRQKCILQIGGSDQWGNIVNGTDLIKRKEKKLAYGLTTPLLTLSSGVKMGKTEKGAIWLNKKMLSPYDYWQFWRNTDDKDVINFLKLDRKSTRLNSSHALISYAVFCLKKKKNK